MALPCYGQRLFQSDQRMENKPSFINSDSFRALLGNYPTGIAVVTGLEAGGLPLGMVVGTFTSVSLDPPLVAFLPMKTSRTFNRLRESSDRFSINILAADQESVCRTLAAPGENKFADIAWRTSPAGNPIIDGVVGWIDCEYENVVDGGDHHIVLGAVKGMGLERDVLPLLFFQRGYGRFAAGPRVLANDRDAFRAVRYAEAARDEIEAISRELQVGCSVVACVGTDAVYVAVSDHSRLQHGKNRLGVRAPIIPPLGTLFIDSPNAIAEGEWLARLGKNSQDLAPRAKEQLDRVRQRGWSISLLGDIAPEELEAAIDRYSCPHHTPEQERQFLSMVSAMYDMHEPDSIVDDQHYDVLHLSVPVKGPGDETVLVLRLSELPPQICGSEVLRLIARLQVAAKKVDALIGAIPS